MGTVITCLFDFERKLLSSPATNKHMIAKTKLVFVLISGHQSRSHTLTQGVHTVLYHPANLQFNHYNPDLPVASTNSFFCCRCSLAAGIGATLRSRGFCHETRLDQQQRSATA
jgi:hypothetical protein